MDTCDITTTFHIVIYNLFDVTLMWYSRERCTYHYLTILHGQYLRLVMCCASDILIRSRLSLYRYVAMNTYLECTSLYTHSTCITYIVHVMNSN